MLVSEVLERTYNEWLFPSGINRPTYDKLSAGIDAVTLTIPLTGRVSNIPRDTVLEIGSEQILVDSVAGTVVTAKERGWLETGAATHSLGDIVFVDPKFTRKSLFNALVALIGELYPSGVYARKVDSTVTFSTSEPTKDLPAGGKKVLAISTRTSLNATQVRWNPLRPGIDYREMMEFDPPKYELRGGGVMGGAMQVVYKADFTLPTIETDDLSSLTNPVMASLQPHLPLGIAGYRLQGMEVPRVVIEEIRRRLAVEGSPQVSTAISIGQALLNTFFIRYVSAERERLKETDPAGIEFSRR